MKGLLTCNLYLYYPYIIKQTDNENIQIYQVKVVILSHYTYIYLVVHVLEGPVSLKLDDIMVLIKTIPKFSNVIGYHHPDLRSNRTVYTSWS